MWSRARGLVVSLLGVTLTTFSGTPVAVAQQRVPVVLDTDIGGDIDDAFAMAMLLQSPGIELKAVTTVSGDTAARARIAAKMVSVAGVVNVPVAAGVSEKGEVLAQAKWAEGFHGGGLTTESAVETLRKAIDREHGRMVVIAIGPLTNVAALLKKYPQEKQSIREIVLMGGSVRRGYTPGSGPTPEYNIAADAASARAVFSSGVPIRMAPLDVTAGLQLDERHRGEIFSRHTPVTDSLRALYVLWNQPTPTLHDPMAVSMLTDPLLCKTEELTISIDGKGMTLPRDGGKPNATVATETDPSRFLAYYTQLLVH